MVHFLNLVLAFFLVLMEVVGMFVTALLVIDWIKELIAIRKHRKEATAKSKYTLYDIDLCKFCPWSDGGRSSCRLRKKGKPCYFDTNEEAQKEATP